MYETPFSPSMTTILFPHPSFSLFLSRRSKKLAGLVLTIYQTIPGFYSPGEEDF